MKNILLPVLAYLAAFCLHAQSDPYYIQQFDAAEGNTLCFDADSNIWIGCVRDRQPLLLKVTRGGILLEQVAFNFPFGQYSPPADLLVDAEGMLVGCGVMFPAIPSNNESSYIFRYDPVTRQMLWNRRIAHTFFFARGILEPEPGSDYILYGRDYALSSTTEILTINRETGDILPASSFTYKMGREEDLDAVVLHQGDFYATGRNDLGYLTSTFINLYVRQGVWKIGPDGTPQWAVVGSVPNNKKSNIQGRDLLIEDGAIYAISSGNDQSEQSAPSNIFLQKTSLDGTPLWVRKYDITTFNFNAELGGNLISVPDGFIIFGKSTRDFLLKTDKDGKLLWAQRLPTANAGNWQYRPRRHIVFDGDGILVVSTLRDNPTQSRAVLMRIDLNGNIAGCNRLSALNAVEVPVPNPFWTNLPLQVSPHGAQSLSTPTTLPDPAPTALARLCENEGPDLDNPCLPATFLKKITPGAGQSRMAALAGAGDTLYGAFENGLVASIDLDGYTRWSVQIETPAGDTLQLSDLILDSEGMLAIRGRLGQAVFACRLDPAARQVLWSQTIPSLPYTGGGILETGPGEAYLLHHNLQLPDGRQVPETFQLDRQTGNVLALSGRRYDFDQGDQSHLAMTRNGNQLYASGRYETAAGPRLGVSRLDVNFGGPVWSQWGHAGPADPGSGGGSVAGLYDDDHLILVYTGSSTDPAHPFGQLFLQKTNPAGSILWVRRCDLPLLGELDITAVPGGYVILGKTAAASYALLKTDRNGNLLLSKNISFGAGGGDPAHTPGSRFLFHNDYLWLALYDVRPGHESAWLLKTDLNLESTGPCSYTAPASVPPVQTVLNPAATSAGLPVFVTPFGYQSANAAAPDAAISIEQVCPPVYVEPMLSIGADRSICSPDTAVINSNAGFKEHLWQDGQTGLMYKATSAGVYWLQALTLCDKLQSDTVVVNVAPNPSQTVIIAAAAGVSVTIQGTAYFAPDSVTVRVPSGMGICDTLLTYFITACSTVQTVRTIQFNPGETVELDGFTYSQPGIHTHTLQTVFGCDSLVTYDLEWILTDQEACDVKEPGGCIRYELVGIYLEANSSKRYRMRIVNNCTVPLDYVTFQLPNGLAAQWPANNAIYTAPSGNTYTVRNPNFNSIRFKISGGALSNGGTDIFEYVLPPQAEPAYILATARLSDGWRSSTHLSALGCPPEPWAGNREAPSLPQRPMLLRPNPAVDWITLELPVQNIDAEWLFQVADLNGRIVLSNAFMHDGQTPVTEDIHTLPPGLYQCTLQSEAGLWTAWFVVLR
jgi:outer membrane protein assembly factor BamB